MLQKRYFSKNTPHKKIIEVMKKERFYPKLIKDPPHFVYESHQHPETKFLVCLEGSMEVIVEGEKYLFEPGDKLIIPGNTSHQAIVGDKGCIFFWSEKII